MSATQNIQQISKGKLIWQMTRPHTLTATFVPVVLGTVMAINNYSFKIDMFISMMLAGLALQIATNLFNEYYDFKKGLDTAESVGIGGGIVRHGIQPQTVLNVAFLLYVIAAGLGVYICMNSSWWLVAIGVAGMGVGYFYTAGPLPIAYTPFGELFAGLSMGIGFILIAYFLQSGVVDLYSFLLSVPIGILVGAINMSNNIRDIDEDIKGGRKTLAILLGRERAIKALAIAFMIAFGWIFVLAVLNVVSAWICIVFFGIKKPLTAIQSFRLGAEKPKLMGLAMKSTALTNTFFGTLMTIGLLISYIF